MSFAPPPRSGSAAPPLVTLAAMALTVGVAEFAAGRLASSPEPSPTSAPSSSTAVGCFEFPHTAFPATDNASDRPLVLVLGNSHTYTLPSEAPGRPMRIGGAGIFPDELARLAAAAGLSYDVGLLSYPNFLPFEMLVRCVQLDGHGYRPRAVVLGLTWRNVARDSQLRTQVAEAFREPDLAERVVAAVRATTADPAPLEARIAETVRRLAREAEAERLKSDADRTDERLFDHARRGLHLVGDSAELRSRLYRAAYGALQRRWEERSAVDYSYSLIDADYRFNDNALRALLQWYAGRGVKVFVYLAPERDDLPPLMDPARQTRFVDEFRAWAEPSGVDVVDARRVVPNEQWGYDFDTPDRSHFALPGHRLLAEFLWPRLAPTLSTPRAATGAAAEESR